MPVLRDGEHRYDLFCQLLPSTFSNLLAQQGLPPGYVAAITDGNGTIIARSRENDKFIGTTVSRDLLNALLVRPEGSVSGKTLDGVPVVAGYSQSQKTGWTVVIAIPRELLTRDLHYRIVILASLTLLALVVGLGAAWRIGNRIIQANRGLIAPALALGEGQPITLPQFAFREANEVGDALMKAAARLAATQHQAHHDSLTGLLNRSLFYEIVARQLMLAVRNRSTACVLFIDLDGFKQINDQFGHAAGDEILRQVAGRLTSLLRASDLPSRFGGDEFAVALSETTRALAGGVAKKLLDGLSMPYLVNGLPLQVSASIGIALSDGKNTSVEALVRAADDAMYVAKEAGKAGMRFSEAA